MEETFFMKTEKSFMVQFFSVIDFVKENEDHCNKWFFFMQRYVTIITMKIKNDQWWGVNGWLWPPNFFHDGMFFIGERKYFTHTQPILLVDETFWLVNSFMKFMILCEKKSILIINHYGWMLVSFYKIFMVKSHWNKMFFYPQFYGWVWPLCWWKFGGGSPLK